jgi:hypothetical protein
MSDSYHFEKRYQACNSRAACASTMGRWTVGSKRHQLPTIPPTSIRSATTPETTSLLQEGSRELHDLRPELPRYSGRHVREPHLPARRPDRPDRQRSTDDSFLGTEVHRLHGPVCPVCARRGQQQTACGLVHRSLLRGSRDDRRPPTRRPPARRHPQRRERDSTNALRATGASPTRPRAARKWHRLRHKPEA